MYVPADLQLFFTWECLLPLLLSFKSLQSVFAISSYFKDFMESDFARSGNAAVDTVVLPEGPLDLDLFQHSMEPQLRKLGLPTTLKKGMFCCIYR